MRLETAAPGAAFWPAREGRVNQRPMCLGTRVMICLPCLLVGGTEVHTIALASALRAGGFAVTVCCYYEYDPITVAALRQKGIVVELLGLDRVRTNLWARIPALAQELAATFRRHQPQIVHVQYMAPGAWPLAAARVAGVPHVIATIHVTAGHYGRKSWLPRQVATPLCDAFICVSQVAERSFFGDSSLFDGDSYDLGRRRFTIHNSVDLPVIDQIRRDGRDERLAKKIGVAGRPVVGIVGRLDPYKGHDVLLHAFGRIRQTLPQAMLLCVGDGAWKGHLVSLAAELGLSRQVIWTGQMAQADVFRHIQWMDVVVMPSREGLEGFGLAAAEAMALVKPVVASRVDGLAEVVGDDDAGCLVAPGDVSELAGAMARLLGDAGERHAIGLAGRARVERLFSPKLFAERHRRLYQLVLSRGLGHSRRAVE